MNDDGLEHNPEISCQALAALHEGAFGWALSLTGYDGQAAEDVMQQTYLALIEGKARYKGRSSLKTWLYGVVRNSVRRHIRSQRLERRRIDRYASSLESEAAVKPMEASDDLPADAIRTAVHNLPNRQREVLELVIDAEFTLQQTAEVLGISVGSARTHYHRAKKTLRGQFWEDDEQP